MTIEDLTVELNSLMMGKRLPFTTDFVQQFVDLLPEILMTMPDGCRLNEIYEIRKIGIVASCKLSTGRGLFHVPNHGWLPIADAEHYGVHHGNVISWLNIRNHMDVISLLYV